MSTYSPDLDKTQDTTCMAIECSSVLRGRTLKLLPQSNGHMFEVGGCGTPALAKDNCVALVRSEAGRDVHCDVGVPLLIPAALPHAIKSFLLIPDADKQENGFVVPGTPMDTQHLPWEAHGVRMTWPQDCPWLLQKCYSKGRIASLVGYAPCILLDVVGIVSPHNDRPVHFC